MQEAIRFEDYAGLAREIVRQVRTKFPATDTTDLFQEVSVAFVKARNAFDATRGVSFSTYFWRTAVNHLKNLAVEEFARYSHETHSMDEQIGEDGDTSLGEPIADDGETPEVLVLMRDAAQNALARLEPTTRLVVQWVANPPKIVVQEWLAVRERMKRGAQMGHRRVPPASITLTFVMQVMGLNKPARTRVREDIRRKFGIVV